MKMKYISLHSGPTRRARVIYYTNVSNFQVQDLDVGLDRFGTRRVFICVDRVVIITSLHFCHIIREIFVSVEVQTAQEVMVSKHFLITLIEVPTAGKKILNNYVFVRTHCQ